MSLSLYFFLELETRERLIVQRVHLYIWTIAGHQLTAIGARVQSFRAKLLEHVSRVLEPTPTASNIMTHCIWKSICGSPLIYWNIEVKAIVIIPLWYTDNISCDGFALLTILVHPGKKIHNIFTIQKFTFAVCYYLAVEW